MPTQGAALDYEASKALAVHPDPSRRAALAARPDLRPELLFYLADDDDPQVRRAVAANAATPVRASSRLARDRDDDVRRLLAIKLARALPGLTANEQAALRDIAHNALELLAADHVVRVRAALASALKDVEVAPPRLIARLARDVACEVADPILRTCALLSDEDLVVLISTRPEPWVRDAIARRPMVSPMVERALAAAAGGLPAKEDARPTLSPHLAARLGAYVEEELHASLRKQDGFDDEARSAIADVTQRRLDWARDYVKREQPELRAARLFDAGRLDEAAVTDALTWGDRAFVQAALGLMARIPVETVRRILDTQSPKAVTALAWRAGLSMRGARALQEKAARIHPRRVLNARHGIDFPLTKAELLWQLEFFGIPVDE